MNRPVGFPDTDFPALRRIPVDDGFDCEMLRGPHVEEIERLKLVLSVGGSEEDTGRRRHGPDAVFGQLVIRSRLDDPPVLLLDEADDVQILPGPGRVGIEILLEVERVSGP